MATHTSSQRYLSTRGGSYDLPFEDVVLKGLAEDGGLFIPEAIPSIPNDWATAWSTLSFNELACEIFSLYISSAEVPSKDLVKIVTSSYSTFRAPDITPLVTLDADNNIYLLELFHGPTFAFKDVALQFLGNLFEYFLTRSNKDKEGSARKHLTVIGATSGDTGSAAIYGLRGKKDVSILMMHPKGKISPIQEAQMTTVMDDNVHNLAVDGTFDDCQDFVKALFQDSDINKTHKLGAVNSINWARILAQITYYFHAYFSLLKSKSYTPGCKVRFVVPTGNFGDILAGYFAKRMGLPVERLVIATNENDILDRFWKTGSYEKHAAKAQEANGGIPADGSQAHEHGVRETLSPAMDILVSSNFERLLWFLAYDVYGHGANENSRKIAGQKVKHWLDQLKSSGGFSVHNEVLKAAKNDFESERISDEETLATIKEIHNVETPAATSGRSEGTTGISSNGGYILDPHSAIGVAATMRSIQRVSSMDTHHIALATAHPAKFANAVELALKDEQGFHFEHLLPEQFKGLEAMPRRVTPVKRQDGLEGLRTLIRERVKTGH